MLVEFDLPGVYWYSTAWECFWLPSLPVLIQIRYCYVLYYTVAALCGNHIHFYFTVKVFLMQVDYDYYVLI